MRKLKDFLRVLEAAEHLGVSPITVRNWESAGKIVAQRNPMLGPRLSRDLAQEWIELAG